MIFPKKILRKLEADLVKHGIRSKAIKACAIDKNRTKQLVRYVLKGDTPDVNGIIRFLDNYLKNHLKELEKMTNEIGNYDN